MATLFQKAIASVNINQLQIDLNNSADFTATCIGISDNGDGTIGLEWSVDLTAEEEAAMDAIISAHRPDEEEIPISTLPLSDLGNKLGVHQSTKPEVPGKEFFLVWTGAGDDVDNHKIGAGDLLTFDFDQPSKPTELQKDIMFDPVFGDVYIHEGYMRFGGTNQCGPAMSALVMASASKLQSAPGNDLAVTDNWVTYVGPGNGTHSFAANPVLIKRSFSHDGDWDYNPTSGLVPNFEGTGLYKISDIDRIAHRYINRVPICGENGYVRLTSDETAYLPPGYFLRIVAQNPNEEPLKCAFFFEVYRERTAVP